MVKHKILIFLMAIILFVVVFSSPAFGSSLKIVAISAGSEHCLALADDGSVWEWGYNYNGALTGNQTDDSIQIPIKVPITNVKAISAGDFQNLALKDDGSVWAWGFSLYDNLGNDLNGANGTFIPIKVSISNITAIYSGTAWSFAVEDDGSVWAWGGNNEGQLGDGTYDNRMRPVKVQISGNISDIDTAGASFAVEDNGSVWAWGSNIYKIGPAGAYLGLLGIRSPYENQSLPSKITGLTNAKSVAVGATHVMVLMNDGTILAWGGDDAGQLGDGSISSGFTFKNMPVKAKIDNIKAISAGFSQSMSLKNDGTVWMWGQNGNGLSSNPYKVSELSDIVEISSGSYHCMALKGDGTVWTWGVNKNIGVKSTDPYSPNQYISTPVQVKFDFSSQATPIIKPENTTITNTNSGNSNSTTLTVTAISLPINSLVIKLLGIFGLIVVVGGAVYLFMRKKY